MATISNIIPAQLEALKLTQLEEQCLKALIYNLYAEPGYSDVDATDIARITGVDIKSVRGALSSLVKKSIIMIDDPNDSGYKIIYLDPEYYYLHPNKEWQDSIN